MFSFIPKRNTQRVFLDYAATTPMSRRTLRAMRPYLSDMFANPSSLHKEGVAAREAIEQARKKVGAVLTVKARDVYFTGGGTESVNLAMLGTVRAARNNPSFVGTPHVLISSIEHEAVHATAAALEKEGVAVSVVPVFETGVIDIDALVRELRPETVFAAVMYVNNEVGTVQPLRDIAQAIHSYKKEQGRDVNAYPYFYTDASQAPNYLSVQIEKLGVDLMTLDGSKIYGPKGVGILYVKPHVAIETIAHGGKQESGLRAGTENVPGIVGFAEALQEAHELRDKESIRMTELSEYFFTSLKAHIPSIIRNGTHKMQLPNIVNVCIPGLHAEFAVLQLDARGVACTSTTACKSNDETGESYVVRALGREDCAASSLRFSLGRNTTKKDIEIAVSRIAETLTNSSQKAS